MATGLVGGVAASLLLGGGTAAAAVGSSSPSSAESLALAGAAAALLLADWSAAGFDLPLLKWPVGGATFRAAALLATFPIAPPRPRRLLLFHRLLLRRRLGL